MFRARVRTFDASGNVWADRAYAFADTPSLLRHIQSAIDDHEHTSVRMTVIIEFPHKDAGNVSDNNGESE